MVSIISGKTASEIVHESVNKTLKEKDKDAKTSPYNKKEELAKINDEVVIAKELQKLIFYES